MSEVLVVGGGPAGLTAALAAARRGFETRLVEASPHLGGMAASFTVAGVRVDHGSHRLHPVASPRVRALLGELLGDDLQVRQRRGRLHIGRRWAAFPLQPMDLVRSVPVGFAAAAARDLATRPLRRPRHDSYAEVIRVGLGPAALDAFHGPMATKLWGIDPDLLSGELARRRIPVRSPGGLVRKLASGSRASGRTFLYPRRGFGQIAEQLAEAAIGAGVSIETDTRVERLVASEAGHGPVVTRAGSAPSRVGRVLWTADPTALARVLDPSCPHDPPVAHRALTLVYLATSLPRWSPYDAHYVPDLDVAFARLSEPRNYRDGDDPDDRTVLCAEVPGSVGDPRWTAGEGELADLVADGIERLGLRAPPLDEIVLRRLPAVYPVLAAGDGQQRSQRLAVADATPGITVLGRHGRIVADNLHHVMEMALAAVDCIGQDGAWDARRWRAETARFETFVVED